MKKKQDEQPFLSVRGARENNLKNINVDIPRGSFSVITGPSGSGKSSLAFNVIYNEGQRRYLEGLSAYARNYLDVGAKPQVDRIENLSPTIAIDQKSIARSPRSTVGTLTEMYDYLRLLFSRAGIVHCPTCGKQLDRQTNRGMLAAIMAFPAEAEILILSRQRTSEPEGKATVERMVKEGYSRVFVKTQEMSLSDILTKRMAQSPIDVVIDRFVPSKIGLDKERVLDSLEEVFRFGEECVVRCAQQQKIFQRNYRCARCLVSLPEMTPRHFSFNNPEGACSACSGLGRKLSFDPQLLISNPKFTLAEGAIGALNRFMGKSGNQTGFWKSLESAALRERISLKQPLGVITKEKLNILLYGHGREGGAEDFPGIIPYLESKYFSSSSDHLRSDLERFMRPETCDRCNGLRLKKESLAVVVGGLNIAQWSGMNLDQLWEHLSSFADNEEKHKEKEMVHAITQELVSRLSLLRHIGISYLTLDRTSLTLSGGEAQRIRLAMQLISQLSGVIYVLDEPSMGLHSRDTQKLIQTFDYLKKAGNSLLVVEHDRDIMEAADWIVDMGPGAGEEGGEVIFSGPFDSLKKSRTLTADYLSGKKTISRTTRTPRKDALVIKGATEHNLQNITVRIPLGILTVITGVSGSGKSTLVRDILSKTLKRHFYGAKDLPGKHVGITGLRFIDKVISINQEAIGRTSRSNVATYTGIFSLIRDVFAETPTAQSRGYDASLFSFNLKGGRCEMCQGEGTKKIEMYLMPDMFVECEACSGTRYNSKTLEIEYHGASVADVLNMSVGYAKDFFRKHPHIVERLRILEEVGLGYLRLGQGAPDLSGGEAQRIKLATELARKSTGKTLYILDEPTIGLHFEDIRRLLHVLDSLLEKGNTVVMVEHNMEVIQCADWMIDLGPEGGTKGGRVIFEGLPKDAGRISESWTGKYLRNT